MISIHLCPTRLKNLFSSATYENSIFHSSFHTDTISRTRIAISSRTAMHQNNGSSITSLNCIVFVVTRAMSVIHPMSMMRRKGTRNNNFVDCEDLCSTDSTLVSETCFEVGCGCGCGSAAGGSDKGLVAGSTSVGCFAVDASCIGGVVAPTAATSLGGNLSSCPETSFSLSLPRAKIRCRRLSDADTKTTSVKRKSHCRTFLRHFFHANSTGSFFNCSQIVEYYGIYSFGAKFKFKYRQLVPIIWRPNKHAMEKGVNIQVVTRCRYLYVINKR